MIKCKGMRIRKRVIELTKTFNRALKECPELIYVGNRALRQKTKEVDFKEGLEVAERLKKVLKKYREITRVGRGLAAPQIDESKTVFITYLNDVFSVYINPKIVWQSRKTNCYREGCLSSGTLWADVKRPASIIIRYTDEQDKTQEKKVKGLLARLLQHEYDHLQGIVNLDKALPGSIEFWRDPLKEKLRRC